jgi:glycosyltransferase involved in cell wall biosynthesis
MSSSHCRIGLYMNLLLGWQGGKEYARNLLLSLQAYQKDPRPGPFEVHLFGWQPFPAADLDEFRPLAHGVHIIPYDKRKGTQSIFDSLDRNRIDFIFPLHFEELVSTRTAEWIFDFQHKYLSHLFSASDIRHRDAVFTRMLEYADRVIVSSETARADLHTFLPGHDEVVRVLPFATFPKREWIEPDPLPILRRYRLPQRYFLLSAQFWVHKNHLLVFQALKHLLDQGVQVDLVCTGSMSDYRKPTHIDDMLAFLHENGIYPQVRLMGLMPRLHQLQVMRCALAVIQPSLFEGWSTVLEDARTFGKKTLCSSLAIHREQNLPEAEFFAPDNAEELATLMLRIWKSDSPGMDSNRESRAFEAAENRALAFAHAFYSIASEPFAPNRRHYWERAKKSIRRKTRRFLGKRARS